MRVRPVCVVAAVAVMLAGCGRREERQTTAVPLRTQGDSLIHAIAPELTEWVAMWRAAMPAFELDSLSSGAPYRWHPDGVVTVQPDSAGEHDVTFQILGLPSPDGRRILDIDSYQLIQIGRESAAAGGEPDSRSALIDRRAGTEAVIFMSGTTGGAHWGRWLSPDRFVLAGWQDADENAERRLGWLSVYDLRDSTVAGYTTPIVSAADYDRYYAAWERWLMKRFREIQARPRT